LFILSSYYAINSFSKVEESIRWRKSILKINTLLRLLHM
jgi:hypothetical protein